MRIVHWAKYYPPEWGGTEGITYDLAVGASAAGHEVEVVAFTRDNAREEEDRGVVVRRAKVALRVDTQPLSYRWARLAVRAARTADVVHIHAPNLLAAMLLPFVPRRVRIVTHWHTDLVDKGLLGRLTRPLELLMARRTDVLLATSATYAEASPVLSRFPKTTAVVPLGVADAALAPASPSVPAAIAAFLAGRPMVLAVGRTVPYKGFEYLIRAAAEMRSDAAVVIVGSGPLEEDHKRLVAELGVGERVLMAGRLAPPDLQALFRAATLYAMSSCKRSEAFGIVMLEAMAHGLPIVATRIEGSGVAWVAGEGETGPIVPSADPTALAEAIDALIADPERRAALSSRARDRYERLFTPERMLSTVQALYDPRFDPAAAQSSGLAWTQAARPERATRGDEREAIPRRGSKL